MQFDQQRRQQFLNEARYLKEAARLPDEIQYFAKNPVGSGSSALHKEVLARQTSAECCLDLFSLCYTAGGRIDNLRSRLDEIVAAYERYGELLWQYRKDRNEFVFDFTSLDEYCQLMQIIGLCFLLHRRDLLPRVAALQDGDNGATGGSDTLYEEFMAYGMGPEIRYESDWICHKKPYEPLFHGLTEATPEAGLKEIDLFLKNWYKDLSGTGWHDSHKPQAR